MEADTIAEAGDTCPVCKRGKLRECPDRALEYGFKPARGPILNCDGCDAVVFTAKLPVGWRNWYVSGSK